MILREQNLVKTSRENKYLHIDIKYNITVEMNTKGYYSLHKTPQSCHVIRKASQFHFILQLQNLALNGAT